MPTDITDEMLIGAYTRILSSSIVAFEGERMRFAITLHQKLKTTFCNTYSKAVSTSCDPLPWRQFLIEALLPVDFAFPEKDGNCQVSPSYMPYILVHPFLFDSARGDLPKFLQHHHKLSHLGPVPDPLQASRITRVRIFSLDAGHQETVIQWLWTRYFLSPKSKNATEHQFA